MKKITSMILAAFALSISSGVFAKGVSEAGPIVDCMNGHMAPQLVCEHGK